MAMERNIPLPAQMMQFITGAWLSQLVYAAAKLGIADILKDGPKTSDQLAELTGMHAGILYRVMRSLASVGIFVETEPKLFGLTPLAECLENNNPNSVRKLAIFCGEQTYRAWADVLYTVKTGKPAFEQIYNLPLFDYLSQNSEVKDTFNEAMTGVAISLHMSVASSYDFSSIKTLVDVGGGQGTLISSILKANPEMRGILFDLPHVVEGAEELMKQAGVADRCALVGGSFFETIPEGGDAYILATVIHDWDDESSIAILKNCRRVMPANGKLLLAEMVIPAGNEPFFGKFLDLNMIVMSGGQERTEAEYRKLFEAAGFTLTKIVHTNSPVCVIEGVPN
jgi:hypothetical protein